MATREVAQHAVCQRFVGRESRCRKRRKMSPLWVPGSTPLVSAHGIAATAADQASPVDLPGGRGMDLWQEGRLADQQQLSGSDAAFHGD